MIYLDNAATTGKKPETVIRAVRSAMTQYCANPGRSGHAISMKAALAVYRVREKAARFFGCEGPEQVVFTASCTHSINYVLKGVLQSGSHVIISDYEHNAVVRPLVALKADFDVAKAASDDVATVENFRRLIRPDTKMIFVTGASNVFGRRLPIDALGKLCQEEGILFGVDAAQIAGIVPINMIRQHIDFLCVAPHKGLYAPMGIGILIARKNVSNTIIEGGTGTESANLMQPENLPERLESGTLNLPGIFGISAGMDFVRNLGGEEKIALKEMRIVQNLYDGLRQIPNIRLYTPRITPEKYVPVLSFNFAEKNSAEVAAFLDQQNIAVRAGLHCAPFAHRKHGTLDSGTVRVSPSVFSTERDIQQFLSVLNRKN